MAERTCIAVDLAKSVFEIAVSTRPGRVRERLRLSRAQLLQEIEERKWAEEMLRESRIFAESIVETIREPLLVLDSELRIIKTNRSFNQIFKIKPQQVIHKLFHKINGSRWDIPELLEKLYRVLPENSQFERFEVTRDFGRLGVRTMLLNARPIYRMEVDTNLILLAIDDITDRVLAQEAARRLVRGVESAAEAIIMTNIDGIIEYVNPAFTTLTGYESGEGTELGARALTSQPKPFHGISMPPSFM